MQALKDGGVLAVHRQNIHTVGLGGIGHQVPTGYQRFFIRQRQGLFGLNGRQRGLQAHHTHYGVQYRIRAGIGSTFDQAVHTGQYLGARICHPGAQIVCRNRIHHRHQIRAKLANLCLHQINATVSGQAHHPIAVHTANIQALCTDRAGRA